MDKKELLKQIEEGKQYTYFGFWGQKSESLAERMFSNFYQQKFSAPLCIGKEKGMNVIWLCSEQYFMYLKACLFKDEEMAEKIFLTKSGRGKEYQLLGKQVRNFDEETWDTYKQKIMYKAVYYKFLEKSLKKELLSTGDAILVETSPYDAIWGIGMSKKENNWNNPRKWKGSNLLGFTLMQVREKLRD